MTKNVRRDKYLALISLAEEFLREEGLENGERTTMQEVVSLVRGRLNSLKGKK